MPMYKIALIAIAILIVLQGVAFDMRNLRLWGQEIDKAALNGERERVLYFIHAGVSRMNHKNNSWLIPFWK